MSRFMINVPDDPTKQEEIEALEKLAEKLPNNSYLKGLFTPDMVGWVKTQIKGDIMPDLHWQSAEKGVINSRMAYEIHDLKRDLERSEIRVKLLESRIYHLKDDIFAEKDEAKKAINDLRQQIQNEQWQSAFWQAHLTTKIWRLKSALGKMREYGRNREQLWQFTLDKIRG